MKSIIAVNTMIPGRQEFLEYDSGTSLKDYDIILFDPKMPAYGREHFNGGGSCIDVEDSITFVQSSNHWNDEITEAMKDGKTIFFVLNKLETDLAASGSSYAKSTRTFHTSPVDNYRVLPLTIKPHNASGAIIKVSDSRFTDLYDGLKPYMKYKVNIPDVGSKGIFTTKDGSTALGMIQRYKDMKGHLVFLPFFSLEMLYKTNAKGEQVWTDEGMGAGTKLVKQLVEIDKVLRKASAATPAPTWVESVAKPKLLHNIKKGIEDVDAVITKAQEKRLKLSASYEDAESFQSLLFETGTLLEEAIQKILRVLGYTSENYRQGSLEIDHIITSPEGIRFIGEAEGKDKSAIDVSKFRQLESNIGEDLEREEVSEPAHGILFGNGYRLSEPSSRDIQFTDKCVLNAKRLNTVLVQTADLYTVAIYLQDNPSDEIFKKSCRSAIESSQGEVVVFPDIPNKKTGSAKV